MEDSLTGYVAALIAIVCFGSNFVFAKNVELGDGVIFQFCMCCAIWCTSIPVLINVGTFPANTNEFSTAMLGGALWCTGNMMCGPIVQLVGLTLGLLLWGSTNMLMGWASGTFGLFGLTAEHVDNLTLNYFGVFLAVVGLIFYLQVQPNENSSSEYNYSNSEGNGLLNRSKDEYGTLNLGASIAGAHDHYSPLAGGEKSPISGASVLDSDIPRSRGDRQASNATGTSAGGSSTSGPYFSTESSHFHLQEGDSCSTRDKADPFKSLSQNQRRLLGFTMALIAGTLFGCSFDPSQYIIDSESDSSIKEDNIVFVFPQFCGILFTSFFYTIIYCMIKVYYYGDKPYVNSDIILPGFLSGIVWGIANISWFIANQNLGFSVSFPLITSGPGFVGALWGIVKYNEISGKRNFMFLIIAFFITIIALIMVGTSHG
jgi:glucose uptake protein GlcU